MIVQQEQEQKCKQTKGRSGVGSLSGTWTGNDSGMALRAETKVEEPKNAITIPPTSDLELTIYVQTGKMIGKWSSRLKHSLQRHRMGY